MSSIELTEIQSQTKENLSQAFKRHTVLLLLISASLTNQFQNERR
jgi:hypothetical protein